MDRQDQDGAASSLVRLLRRVTRIVQLVPFVYLFFYSAYMLLGSFLSEEVLCLADSVLFVSPVTTGGLLVASRIFKLCRWHRAACLLPMSSQVEGYIDSFVFTFTQEEIIIVNLLIGLSAIIFLFVAIRHFVHG